MFRDPGRLQKTCWTHKRQQLETWPETGAATHQARRCRRSPGTPCSPWSRVAPRASSHPGPWWRNHGVQNSARPRAAKRHQNNLFKARKICQFGGANDIDLHVRIQDKAQYTQERMTVCFLCLFTNLGRPHSRIKGILHSWMLCLYSLL